MSLDELFEKHGSAEGVKKQTVGDHVPWLFTGAFLAFVGFTGLLIGGVL